MSDLTRACCKCPLPYRAIIPETHEESCPALEVAQLVAKNAKMEKLLQDVEGHLNIWGMQHKLINRAALQHNINEVVARVQPPKTSPTVTGRLGGEWSIPGNTEEKKL